MPSIGDQLKLSRGDLTSFPRNTVDLILEMQKNGWRGHRNSQGHVAMLSPDGVTTVMATQNKNSHTYLRQGLNQYNKRKGVQPSPIDNPTPKTTQKWPCARPSCPKVYATEEQLNIHISVDHEGMLLCPEDGCHEVFARPHSLGRHRQVTHGYESPRKVQRKKQEAARAEKKKAVDLAQAITTHDVDSIKNLIIAKDESEIDPSITPAQAWADVIMRAPDDGVKPNWIVDAQGGIKTVVEPESTENLEVVRTDPVEFLDERDSWVVDHSLLGRRRIRDLEEMFKAAGLSMEIRVWKS